MQALRNLRTLAIAQPRTLVSQNAGILSRFYSAHSKTLKIEPTFVPQSNGVKTKEGDNIEMHYKGSLTDGTEFDQSYKRGSPLPFQLGAGQVIAGWDQGLLDMKIGEKRTLTIPSDLAYGDQGFPGVIPPGATLVFETELVSINSHKE